MSAEAAIAVKSWPVGAYTCTLTVQRPKRGALVHAAMEWAPSLPSRLTEEELAQYRTGRDKALADVSRQLGINAAVLEA